MKKRLPFEIASILFSISSCAQTQKDWYIIGGNISNTGLSF